MRDHPLLPAGRGYAPVRLIDQRRDVSRRAYSAGGFTLLEVVLVIGLMVLLAAFAWPAIQRRFEHSQLPESGDQMRSLMELTRAQAMMDHRRYRIRFAPNERQPIVEWEKDPFQAPGKFELVKADWTADDRLMGDAEVHEVRPGRPEYTLPLDDERSEQQQTETTEVVVGGEDGATPVAEDESATAPPPAEKMDDAPIDEKRPPLIFEPDGSSDWATIIVANVTSEKPLEDGAEQIWIEIDGRSGLASIRPPLSEQEMADESTRVPRSKLRPPEVAFGKDMSINAVTQQTGAQGKQDGEQQAGLGGAGAGGQPKLPDGASSLDALNQLNKLAGSLPQGGGDANGQGKQPPERKPGDGLPGQRPPRQRPPQGQPSQGENQNQQNQDNHQQPPDGSQDNNDQNNQNDQNQNQNNDNQNDPTTQPGDQQP